MQPRTRAAVIHKPAIHDSKCVFVYDFVITAMVIQVRS